ncbi:MAG: zf-HC2 domain-containing protein, partial [Candidatus Limnocylindria bacterium]
MSERPAGHAADDLELYALGALPAEGAARVAAHLAQCAECRGEAIALARVVDELPLTVAEREPPARLREG